jgi:hypothetical protein
LGYYFLVLIGLLFLSTDSVIIFELFIGLGLGYH